MTPPPKTNPNDSAMDTVFEKVILWQDHSHPNGYRPTLKLLKYPGNVFALQLSVHGTVYELPYTKAECGHE